MPPTFDQAPSLTIVIPCYNEADGIPALRDALAPAIQDLRRHREVDIILVDDGSRDDTYELATRLLTPLGQVQIIRHPHNMGIGAALRTGCAHAGGDVVCTIDSDCTYDPITIAGLVRCIDSGAEVATGSPYHPQGGVEGVGWLRLRLSHSCSRVYRCLLRRPIHTWTSCFRAYRRDVLAAIESEADDFLYVTETLVNAALGGFRIAEFPTTLRVRTTGSSKMRVGPVIIRHMRYISSLLFARGLGRQRRTSRPSQTP